MCQHTHPGLLVDKGRTNETCNDGEVEVIGYERIETKRYIINLK